MPRDTLTSIPEICTKDKPIQGAASHPAAQVTHRGTGDWPFWRCPYCGLEQELQGTNTDTAKKVLE